jgi:hypothetical protein
MFRNSSNRSSVESNEDETEFSDRSVRKKFIAKVHATFIVQCLITFGLHFAFKPVMKILKKSHESKNKNFKMLVTIMVCSFLVFWFITAVTFNCAKNLRRKMPMNVIFLFMHSMIWAFLLELFEMLKGNYFLISLATVAAISCFFMILSVMVKLNGKNITNYFIALQLISFQFIFNILLCSVLQQPFLEFVSILRIITRVIGSLWNRFQQYWSLGYFSLFSVQDQFGCWKI